MVSSVCHFPGLDFINVHFHSRGWNLFPPKSRSQVSKWVLIKMKHDYFPKKPKKFLPRFVADLQQIILNIIVLCCLSLHEPVSYLFLIPSSLSPIAVYLAPRACLYRSTLSTSPWSRQSLSKSLSASRLISSKFGFWLWTFLLRSWFEDKISPKNTSRRLK